MLWGNSGTHSGGWRERWRGDGGLQYLSLEPWREDGRDEWSEKVDFFCSVNELYSKGR